MPGHEAKPKALAERAMAQRNSVLNITTEAVKTICKDEPLPGNPQAEARKHKKVKQQQQQQQQQQQPEPMGHSHLMMQYTQAQAQAHAHAQQRWLALAPQQAMQHPAAAHGHHYFMGSNMGLGMGEAGVMQSGYPGAPSQAYVYQYSKEPWQQPSYSYASYGAPSGPFTCHPTVSQERVGVGPDFPPSFDPPFLSHDSPNTILSGNKMLQQGQHMHSEDDLSSGLQPEAPASLWDT